MHLFRILLLIFACALAPAARAQVSIAWEEIDTSDASLEISQITGLQPALDAKLSITAATGTYQPLDADLSAIAALSTTSFGRALLAIADAATLRSYAGLVIGTNVQAWDADLNAFASDPVGKIESVLGLDPEVFVTALNLTIGEDVQEWSTVLDDFAADPFEVVYSATDNDPAYMRSLIQLGNVDNTADLAKPVSTAQEARITIGDATRAVEGWLYSDGATINRGIIQRISDRHNLAGAAFASWVGWVQFPATNPTATIRVSDLTDSAGLDPSTRTNRLTALGVTNTGVIFVSFAGSPLGTGGRVGTFAGGMAAYAGKEVFVNVKITKGAADPVVEFDGVDISGSFTFTSEASPLDWLDNALSMPICITGYGWGPGVLPRGAWLNRHLTSTESEILQLLGPWPADCLAGGSQVPITLSAWDGSLNITSFASASSTGWTGDPTAAAWRAQITSGTIAAFAGRQYRVSFTGANIPTGTTFQLREGTSTSASNAVAVVAGANSFVVTASSSGSLRPTFYSSSGVGATGTAVSDFAVRSLGLLSLPTVGPDRVVRDATRLSPPQDGYLVGVTPQTTIADGWIRGRRTSDGYLVADTQLVGDGRGIVQIMAKSVSGGTVSIGESAGSPATLVASVSLTAGATTPLTLLKSIPAGGKIYIDLGTATDVEIYVRTGPVVSLVLRYQADTQEALLAGLFADRWRADLPLAA